MDYNESNQTWVLRVPRSTNGIRSLMTEHGLDFSPSASSAEHAVLFTQDPYAAASFAGAATERAKFPLQTILAEIEASWKSTSSAHFAVPEDKELWEFQKADIEYALRRRNTLVGDQPGLGKTEVAIAFANEIKARNILVICPANIRIQWANRINEWSTTPAWQRRIHLTRKSKDGTHPPDNARVVYNIVSYDLARHPGIGAALARSHYDLLILDEPHYLKEVGSQRTRAIFGGGLNRTFEPIADRADRIFGLTGTPLPNRPREAFPLAKGLCWDAIDWMSHDAFLRRYNPSQRIERVDPQTGAVKMYIDERSGRHYELQNRLRANFMVRHLKHGPHGVMHQLKMPVYDLIQVTKTAAVKQALKAESFLHIDPENLEGADATILGQIATARRLMGVAMAPQVADYVSDLINSGEEKITLFAWHIEVLDILEEKLSKHGLVRIDGSTGAQRKEAYVKRFITDPRTAVCLGNLLSMGVGTDGLQQVCNHGLIAEPDWTPGVNIQAFDRLDRGGQRQQVQGDIFVAPGSLAEKILAKALRKGAVIHKTLDERF
jgi:SWI/SNF-related matrix-associated actin-dependent regulator of chromatin subfamily A-like protein 1